MPTTQRETPQIKLKVLIKYQYPMARDRIGGLLGRLDVSTVRAPEISDDGILSIPVNQAYFLGDAIIQKIIVGLSRRGVDAKIVTAE